MATAFDIATPAAAGPASEPPRSGVTPIPSFSLLGKKVFVTGGSRGIGRACALTLAAAGADVAVGASPSGAELADEVCREIDELGRRARPYCFDVSAPRDVEAMCARINDELEGIDVLVNNAGITRDTLLMRMTEEQWDEVINTNLKSAFNLTKAVQRPMLKARSGSSLCGAT